MLEVVAFNDRDYAECVSVWFERTDPRVALKAENDDIQSCVECIRSRRDAQTTMATVQPNQVRHKTSYRCYL